MKTKSIFLALILVFAAEIGFAYDSTSFNPSSVGVSAKVATSSVPQGTMCGLERTYTVASGNNGNTKKITILYTKCDNLSLTQSVWLQGTVTYLVCPSGYTSTTYGSGTSTGDGQYRTCRKN